MYLLNTIDQNLQYFKVAVTLRSGLVEKLLQIGKAVFNGVQFYFTQRKPRIVKYHLPTIIFSF